jgi:hypothetical protein
VHVATEQKNDFFNDAYFVYPKYFGPWLSGFLETNSNFIYSELKLTFSQQIDIYLINIIKHYFQHCPNYSKNVNKQIFSNRFCFSPLDKEELKHMINHFNQNPMLGVFFSKWLIIHF